MKKTVNVRDNYSNKLRDEVSADLKGIVDIQVRNKKTGEIEETQRHNMIVFGGREWLLRRAFGPMLSDNDDNLHILNSAIKWVGFGSGGGEPGNPLQSGCTLGYDTDLYNPVRIRYPNTNNDSELSSYYASRMLSDGSIVTGYFKQISYVSLKEDSANPYAENGVIKYPTIIAEIRIELSSDDCNGANYTNLENNVAYQDINEAALFIADATLEDPGKDGQASNVDIIPTGSEYRVNFDSGQQISEDPVIYNDTTIYWGSGESATSNSYFPEGESQYFDFYLKVKNTETTSGDYSEKDGDETVYYTIGQKLNTTPIFMGVKNGSATCCVTVTLGTDETTGQKYIQVVSDPDSSSSGTSTYSITEKFYLDDSVSGEITSLKDDVAILSHGTVYVRYDKSEYFDTSYPVYDTIYYRNTYNQAWTKIIEPHSFVTETTSGYEPNNTVSEGKQWLPIGYIYRDGEWVEIDPSEVGSILFNTGSYIKVNETTQELRTLKITDIVPTENSYEIKCFFEASGSDDTVFDYLQEGMKIYTDEDTEASNTIPADCPLSITSVYNPYDKSQVLANVTKPYFTVDRSGTTEHTYENGLTGYYYAENEVKPYTMFSRVCFSTLRKTVDREIVFTWRLYF